ncbi:ROK family protein [Specibacter sp. RAF43]|uniref:ROK family protein n=1 Tax=Specibacter sp. RAF43 TaxID=3233057 RepID=UPI003F9C068A
MAIVGGSPSGAVLAFDVGGTDLKVGIVVGGPRDPGAGVEDGAEAGGVRIQDLQRHPTPLDGERSGDSVCARIVELARDYRRRHPQLDFSAIGVTVPGIVDEDAGVGVYSANLGWRNYAFTATLTGALGLPVAFGHDVALAGLAEFQIGAAVGRRDVVVLVIGTGIAGAVMCDGRRVSGAGYAGEIGHALVPAPDGSLQILESVASAGAVARRYAAASGQAVPGAREVLELARAGDPAAQRIWAEAVDALAFSVAQCVAVLGTDTVVLGGGLSMAGPDLFEPLAARVDRLLTFQRRPEFVHAALGENAGLIGSALKARALVAAAAGAAGAATAAAAGG